MWPRRIVTPVSRRAILSGESIKLSATQVFRGLHTRTHPDADKAASQVMLVHADEGVFDDGTQVFDLNRLVADITLAGPGGLDTGAELASTWYEKHLIRKSNVPGDPAAGNRNGTEALILHRAKDYFKDQSLETVSDVNLTLRDVAARTKIGQTVQVATAGKDEIHDLRLVKAGVPTGNIWLEVMDNAGAILATSDKFDVSKLSTTSGFVRFPIRLPASLALATTYRLALAGDFAINAVNHVAWQGVVAGGYANGVAQQFDGTTWTAAAPGDLNFKLYITRNDTAVTMPAGYDQKALVGKFFNNASSNFDPAVATGRKVRSLASVTTNQIGTFTTDVAVLADLSAFVPPGPVSLTLAVQHSVAGQSPILSGVPDGFSGSPIADGSTNVTISTAGGIEEATVSTEYQAMYVRGVSATATIYRLDWEWY